ncbi:MAG: hypothetical protein ABIJ27_00730 [Candidatus Omnitrophota bacterium]
MRARTFVFVCGILVSCQQSLFADIITMTSGERVEGSVIVENDDTIIVLLADRRVSRAINRADVVSVDRSPQGERPPEEHVPARSGGDTGGPSLRSRAEKTYLNEESGFYITGPVGWVKHLAPPIHGVKVLFSTSDSPKRIFPGIAVSIDDLPETDLPFKEFTGSIVASQKKSGIAIVEPVKEVRINGIQGVRFTTESKVGEFGYGFRFMHIVLDRGDTAVSIMCVAKTDDFHLYEDDFNRTIASFGSVSDDQSR